MSGLEKAKQDEAAVCDGTQRMTALDPPLSRSREEWF
jgi:hypothetical protein